MVGAGKLVVKFFLCLTAAFDVTTVGAGKLVVKIFLCLTAAELVSPVKAFFFVAARAVAGGAVIC